MPGAAHISVTFTLLRLSLFSSRMSPKHLGSVQYEDILLHAGHPHRSSKCSIFLFSATIALQLSSLPPCKTHSAPLGPGKCEIICLIESELLLDLLRVVWVTSVPEKWSPVPCCWGWELHKRNKSLEFRTHIMNLTPVLPWIFEGWSKSQIPKVKVTMKISDFNGEVFWVHNILNFNSTHLKKKYFLCSRQPLLCFRRIFQ
jgi:hypothetical protein